MNLRDCFASVAWILLMLASGYAQPVPLPERVLVVYNTNSSDSLEVANYYSTKRGIPAANTCAISPTKNDAIDFYNFEINVKKPIQSCLNAIGKEKILYIVFAYETPYKIVNVPTGSILEIRAVDQMIADIWNENLPDIFEISNHPYFAPAQSQGNIYAPFVSFATYRTQSNAAVFYSVWRLDGATKEIAKGLVDKAISAEATGLNGQACIDRRAGAISTLADWSLDAGNWDLIRAADYARKIGITVIEDDHEEEIGTAPAQLRCENVALYAGWYSYNNYNDAFSWANGAIGFHLDSASAVDPRGGANWSANALKKGIAVTSGAVSEPYLEGLPHPDGVFRDLYNGANVGDAFLRNTAFLQWMIINIGDPLYKPFLIDADNFYLQRLSLDSMFLVGGNSGKGKISFLVLPPGTKEINLTSSRPEFVTVPATIQIPGGTNNVEFTITTKPTKSYQPAIITATTTLGSFSNTLTVAPLLSAIVFNPPAAASDTIKSGTIFLNDFAPSGDVTVQLTSDDANIAPVPASVRIEEGKFRADFSFKTGVVSSDATATITAELNGAKEIASLTILPVKRRIVTSRGRN
jgi:uncharacterized protein (TIGR03790 family)